MLRYYDISRRRFLRIAGLTTLEAMLASAAIRTATAGEPSPPSTPVPAMRADEALAMALIDADVALVTSVPATATAQIFDARTKEYFSEVLSCYKAGNYNYQLSVVVNTPKGYVVILILTFYLSSYGYSGPKGVSTVSFWQSLPRNPIRGNAGIQATGRSCHDASYALDADSPCRNDGWCVVAA